VESGIFLLVFIFLIFSILGLIGLIFGKKRNFLVLTLPLQLYLIIDYFNTLVKVYEYLYLIPTTFMTALLIIYYLIQIFSNRKKYLLDIISSITLFVIITTILGVSEVRKHIIYKALKDFKQMPYHVHLNLDDTPVYEPRTPHAVVFKDNDVYYWSFKKDSFYHYGYRNYN